MKKSNFMDWRDMGIAFPTDHMNAAIKTIRNTPNLIEEKGYTLDDFDKTTSELMETWNNVYSIYWTAKESQDPIYQYGTNILLRDTKEHQIVRASVQNLNQKIWDYLCEFINFVGWQKWEF